MISLSRKGKKWRQVFKQVHIDSFDIYNYVLSYYLVNPASTSYQILKFLVKLNVKVNSKQKGIPEHLKIISLNPKILEEQIDISRVWRLTLEMIYIRSTLNIQKTINSALYW